MPILAAVALGRMCRMKPKGDKTNAHAESIGGAAAGYNDTLRAVVDFIKSEIASAERNLRGREQMQDIWAGGSDECWRKVGCLKSKPERLKESAMHGRIAFRNRKELKRLQAILKSLQAHNRS